MNKIKNVKLAELNINSVNVFFNTKIFQDDLIEYNKTYQQKFAKYLKERFLNTYKFSNHDNNKFIWLL